MAGELGVLFGGDMLESLDALVGDGMLEEAKVACEPLLDLVS